MLVRKAVIVVSLLFMIVLSLQVYAQSLFEYKEVRTLEIYAPAVTSTGQGTLSKIRLVVAWPGYGRVFFSALPYTEVETQGAARIAAYIASLVANKSFSYFDYYVLMESTTPLIGGPSAGGIMTVGLTALLLNLPLRPNITMTGMINPDGSIGPVGGLREKLEASAQAGFKVFLVPMGQRVYEYPVLEEYRAGPFVIQRIRYESIDLVEFGRSKGVIVYEASSIMDVIYHFTGVNLTSFAHLSTTTEYNLSRDLSAFVGSLTRKINSTLSDLRDLVNKIPSSYYRYVYDIITNQLSKTYTRLIEMIMDKPAYASRALVDLYKQVLSRYWTLKISLGEASVEDLARYVNDSISELSVRLDHSSSRNPCSLRMSLVSFLKSLALSNYISLGRVNSTESAIEYASEALVQLELARLYDSLDSEIYLDCTIDTLTEAYSNTYAVYTYLSRILENAGSKINMYADVGQYLNSINRLYSNGDPGVLAGYVYVFAYSTLSLHVSYRTLNHALRERYELIRIYDMELDDEIAYYYKQLLEDSLSLEDYETAGFSLLVLIGISQISRSYTKRVYSEFQREKTTEITQPSASITNTISDEPTQTTSEDYSGAQRFLRGIETVLLVLTTVVIVALAVRLLGSTR